MALSIILGKKYNAEDGLSEIEELWYVVGKTTIPIKVDKTLGWRDTNLDKPTFVSSNAFICLPYDIINSSFTSNECSFVPMFGVTNVMAVDDEKIPTVIEGPVFDNEYEISDTVGTWIVQSVNPQPVRIDNLLTWRKPLTAEEPTFLSVDSCVVLPASGPPWIASSTETFNAPMFLVTNIWDWVTLTGSSGGGGGGGIGPMGFQGFQGFQGPDGPQGLKGPQGFQGFQGLGNLGPQGFQGFQGKTGPGYVHTTEEVLYTPFYSYQLNKYYGVTYNTGMMNFYLPIGVSPSDDGKTITISDEDGSISGAGRGITVASIGGQNINGLSTLLMKINRMSVTLMFRNNQWFIYSSYIPAIWSPFSDLQ